MKSIELHSLPPSQCLYCLYSGSKRLIPLLNFSLFFRNPYISEFLNNWSIPLKKSFWSISPTMSLQFGGASSFVYYGKNQKSFSRKTYLGHFKFYAMIRLETGLPKLGFNEITLCKWVSFINWLHILHEHL